MHELYFNFFFLEQDAGLLFALRRYSRNLATVVLTNRLDPFVL